MINIKFSKKVPEKIIEKLKKIKGIDEVIVLNPVLPIISGNSTEIPFTNIASLLEYAEKEKHDLGEIGLIYEKCESGLSKSELLSKMEKIIEIIENSISTGILGTKSSVPSVSKEELSSLLLSNGRRSFNVSNKKFNLTILH